MLAELTKFACVLSTPKASVSKLQRIELIKISEDRILVILVTKAGVVRDKIIFSKESHTQDFLNLVAEFLNNKFKDHAFYSLIKVAYGKFPLRAKVGGVSSQREGSFTEGAIGILQIFYSKGC